MRHHVLRSGLYPADCGTEGDESNGGFLILSLESSISVLAGWDFRAKAFFKEVLGCALMFGAIILAQIPVDAAGKPLSEYGGKLKEARCRRKPVLQKAAGVTECSQSETSQPEPANNTETSKEDSCRILTKGGENIRLPIE